MQNTSGVSEPGLFQRANYLSLEKLNKQNISLAQMQKSAPYVVPNKTLMFSEEKNDVLVTEELTS